MVGVVEPKMFYGEPNYGENPVTDEKDVVAILTLDKALETCGAPNNQYDRRTTAALQMVFHEPPYGKQWNGKRVEVTGKLFPAETGHHYTPVLIDVSDIHLVRARP
ncbi:MAG TPA: DUF4431 domain-containing protein [Rhizomicrobium sp.]